MREAWIIDGVRSPRGSKKPGVGGLTAIHPQNCLGQVLNGLKDKVGFDPVDVDDVVAGCTSGVGDHAMNTTRLAILDAGWPISVPGIKMDRYCGSAQEAVTHAAMGIMAGFQELTVGGGVEFMSHFNPAHPRYSAMPAGFHGSNDRLPEKHPIFPPGVCGDLIGTIEGFSREDCDTVAFESQRRAEIAINEGRFKDSIVPIYSEDETLALDHDEHPRAGTTMEALAGLNPAFAYVSTNIQEGYDQTFEDICKQFYPQIDGLTFMHTGGNSSGVVDGASAILLASPDYAKSHGLKPRAKIVMAAAVGVDPVTQLTGPGPAALKCLERAGMTTSDVDLWEVNEAFASIVLKFMKVTGVDHSLVNVNGGAIALGHPLGATGAMLIETVLDELERQDKSVGGIAMCTGGGMGTATIIERI